MLDNKIVEYTHVRIGAFRAMYLEPQKRSINKIMTCNKINGIIKRNIDK
jgi:hypothetical protein